MVPRSPPGLADRFGRLGGLELGCDALQLGGEPIRFVASGVVPGDQAADRLAIGIDRRIAKALVDRRQLSLVGTYLFPDPLERGPQATRAAIALVALIRFGALARCGLGGRLARRLGRLLDAARRRPALDRAA